MLLLELYITSWLHMNTYTCINLSHENKTYLQVDELAFIGDAHANVTYEKSWKT
jgi:hypothetical protein